MKDNKFLIRSLANDLRRVSTFLHHNSLDTAYTCEGEALKTKNMVDTVKLDSYGRTLIQKVGESLMQKDREKKAENALMCSVLLQNYAQKFL